MSGGLSLYSVGRNRIVQKTQAAHGAGVSSLDIGAGGLLGGSLDGR